MYNFYYIYYWIEQSFKHMKRIYNIQFSVFLWLKLCGFQLGVLYAETTTTHHVICFFFDWLCCIYFIQIKSRLLHIFWLYKKCETWTFCSIVFQVSFLLCIHSLQLLRAYVCTRYAEYGKHIERLYDVSFLAPRFGREDFERDTQFRTT